MSSNKWICWNNFLKHIFFYLETIVKKEIIPERSIFQGRTREMISPYFYEENGARGPFPQHQAASWWQNQGHNANCTTFGLWGPPFKTLQEENPKHSYYTSMGRSLRLWISKRWNFLFVPSINRVFSSIKEIMINIREICSSYILQFMPFS